MQVKQKRIWPNGFADLDLQTLFYYTCKFIY